VITQTLRPADILCVDTGAFWGRFIKAGGWLTRDGGRCDHIVVAHHQDDAGTWWGIEGRPGGAGWVDLTNCTYRLVSANTDQPRTDDQRALICGVVKGLLQTPYDWKAIVVDCMHAIGERELWASQAWGPKAPAHVVCSSLADWAHEYVGLTTPTADRWVTPAQWDRFNIRREWELR
jgi:hypothetical protein